MPAKPRWSLNWAVAVFFCDQATKFWASGLSRPRDIIPGLLSFVPINNSAILFGLWHIPHLKLFTIVFSLLVVYFTLTFVRLGGSTLDFGIGLIWGGMMGNFTDRLISGFVFDFISLWRIPVFNLADAGLTIGATVITVYLLFAKKTAGVVQ